MNLKTRIVNLHTVDQVIRWWDFFATGLEFMNRETKWGESADNFFRVLMHALKAGESKAQILLHLAADATPLGFLVMVDNTPPFGRRSALIYAVFSNKKCPSSFMELVAEARAWAVTNDFRVVQACSYRLNRTSVKLYQRYLPGRKFMVFTTEL